MENRICAAIAGRRLISFYYKDAQRTVEPHMVAYNKGGELALSAWFLHGGSDSNEGPGWRSYLMEKISNLTVSDQTFSGSRPGYQSDGGKSFFNVQCAL